MGLPGVRPVVGAIFISFALVTAPLLMAPPLALAQQNQAEDVFTVRDVEVDVTADSAAAARDQALIAGQRKAFDQLLLTLTTPSEIAALPPLDDNAISDMVLDFEIQSEKVSTVRYLGELAFRFQADAVRQYLEQGGATYAVGSSRPALALPVLTLDGDSLLWDETNAWLAAWSSTPLGGTLVPITVPLGDLADIAAIDAPEALGGDLDSLRAMAQRYGAGDVVVAEAQPRVDEASGEATVALSAKRYSPAGLAGEMQDTLSAPGGAEALPELYAQAARRVSDFLQAEWKQETLVSSTAEQHLDVIAPIASLEQWVELRRRLADVTVVRRADLLALSRRQALLDLVFIGDQAQLTRALAQRNLALTQTQPVAPAPVPQTTGSVTVYPPPGPAPAPRWELHMSGGPVAPGAAPAAAVPAAEPAGSAPATAAPAGPDGAATAPDAPTPVPE